MEINGARNKERCFKNVAHKPQSDAGNFDKTWTFANLMKSMTRISNRVKSSGYYGFVL